MKTTLDSESALNAKAPRREDARMGARNLFRFSARGQAGLRVRIIRRYNWTRSGLKSALLGTAQARIGGCFAGLSTKSFAGRDAASGSRSAGLQPAWDAANAESRQECRRSGGIAPLQLGALALNSVCLSFLVVALSAFGQGPVISSFSHNGELVCTNLEPGTLANVEWACSVNGPWTNTWAGLTGVTVASNGQIRVSVPMFYRVRGIPTLTNNTPPPTNMVLIPAGTFTMGDSLDGISSALPLHEVYISAFYMDKYEVTKALWDEVAAWNDGNGYSYDHAGLSKAADHPVHTVNWFDAVKWCNARSQKDGLRPCYYTDAVLTTVYQAGQVEPYVDWAADGYRLPTEAEWEKAARGWAEGRRFPWADTDDITHSQANYEVWRLFGSPTNFFAYDKSLTVEWHPTFATGGQPYTSPVGYFAANGYGLYDMAGNVAEWCWDWYLNTYYSSSPATDPRGPASGTYRVERGGSWDSWASSVRCASRSFNGGPDTANHWRGFRCVRGR